MLQKMTFFAKNVYQLARAKGDTKSIKLLLELDTTPISIKNPQFNFHQ